MDPQGREKVWLIKQFIDGEESKGILATDSANAVKLDGKIAAGFVLLVGCFACLYHDVIAKLVLDWYNDDNYSHGFLIIPLVLYFAWERRKRLNEVAREPSFWGLGMVLASMAVLMAGVLGSELFLTRISILGSIAGIILFVYGRRHLRILIFPILFLLLMIPIPAIIFNQIAFPLQLIASRFGEFALNVAAIPVLREGNVIRLANTSLEVAEACSGIRSLISLLTLGIVYGYFIDPRVWARTVFALATIPIAILANGLRVAGTGVAAHFYGEEAAQGFFHAFSGWLIFLLAFLMLFVLHYLMHWIYPPPGREPPNQLEEIEGS
jgi:exosortase